MRHDTMEDCLLIAVNNSNWSKQEDEILNKIVEEYLQKKRKIKILDATKESVLASHIVQTEYRFLVHFFLQQ